MERKEGEYKIQKYLDSINLALPRQLNDKREREREDGEKKGENKIQKYLYSVYLAWSGRQ